MATHSLQQVESIVFRNIGIGQKREYSPLSDLRSKVNNPDALKNTVAVRHLFRRMMKPTTEANELLDYGLAELLQPLFPEGGIHASDPLR